MKYTKSAKSRMDAKKAANNKQFIPLFPDISLTFSKIPDITLTAVKLSLTFSGFPNSGYREN